MKTKGTLWKVNIFLAISALVIIFSLFTNVFLSTSKNNHIYLILSLSNYVIKNSFTIGIFIALVVLIFKFVTIIINKNNIKKNYYLIEKNNTKIFIYIVLIFGPFYSIAAVNGTSLIGFVYNAEVTYMLQAFETIILVICALGTVTLALFFKKVTGVNIFFDAESFFDSIFVDIYKAMNEDQIVISQFDNKYLDFENKIKIFIMRTNVENTMFHIYCETMFLHENKKGTMPPNSLLK